ncbi:hypothetical protein Q31b_27450 [Novipirellula aureliae]|uniref:Methanolan biosynthesis EpsI domain-containing protein n=1 Tax=Novipirellula aureliae TaxID=2527966 RepID=A0A5C6E1Q7_9BACT|nr:exosortase C-terminal domain/associated protein EpsI [Novipirellula aureliae]TWU41306.1 hypothetical protein Q31b_27450 [Novipirellula aureliae]
MTKRAILTIALLILGNVAIGHIRSGYSKGQVVPPEKELGQTSLQLGNWVGKELPADDRIRDVLRAQDGIDRVYLNESGENVLVHAVWTDDYIRLHFPQQCYREAGWELRDSEDVLIQCASGAEFNAKVLRFSQAGRNIQVLYWFQLGENIFLDRVQHRLLRRKVCWGQTHWPPLMKFMLETSDTGLGRSEAFLSDLAGRLHDVILVSESTPHPTANPTAAN